MFLLGNVSFLRSTDDWFFLLSNVWCLHVTSKWSQSNFSLIVPSLHNADLRLPIKMMLIFIYPSFWTKKKTVIPKRHQQLSLVTLKKKKWNKMTHIRNPSFCMLLCHMWTDTHLKYTKTIFLISIPYLADEWEISSFLKKKLAKIKKQQENQIPKVHMFFVKLNKTIL